MQRDAGRPTQRQQGLLLLPHGMADGQVRKGLKGDEHYIVNTFLCRKHPAVMKAGKTINMSDLEADSLLMFQHRHYLKCFLMAGFVLPTIIPNLLWGESLTNAYFMAVIRWISFPFICFFTFPFSSFVFFVSSQSPGTWQSFTSPGWSTPPPTCLG